MVNQDIVALEGMRFYSYHGFFEEERTIGNHFVVDVALHTSFQKAVDGDDLSGTINYGEVYEAVKQIMDVPTRLLETLAGRIIAALFERFEEATAITVSVIKKQPPIGGLADQSRITMQRNRE